MLTRCTRGFRLKANDQISLISLIDNIEIWWELSYILPRKQQE